ATISAATELAYRPADEIARRVWSDARAALGMSAAPPPHRVVKERTATFAQTPAEAARRPPARTSLANLVLAGDWTATGLPATIEGAALSGETAARLALAIASENR
ncbi:MAG: FAD-dependent oxidoreductase, partial [Alphaproteobacteria bacterium]